MAHELIKNPIMLGYLAPVESGRSHVRWVLLAESLAGFCLAFTVPRAKQASLPRDARGAPVASAGVNRRHRLPRLARRRSFRCAGLTYARSFTMRLAPLERRGFFIFRMEYKSWYSRPSRIGSSESFGGRTVQGFRGQRLFAGIVDWRSLLIWTLVIVAFCLLFRFGTHTLPSRIAAVILR